MQFTRLFLSILSIIVTSVLIGCAPGTVTRVWYENDPTTPTTQTKQDVTIEVKYVGKHLSDLKKFPQFFVPRNELPEGIRGNWGMIRRESPDLGVWYDFPGMTIYWCKITNNTDHILRMRDARVYLVANDENYAAIQKQDLADAGAPEAEQDLSILKDVIAGSRRLKIVNGFNAEVLPGQSLKGYLFFEIDPSNAVSGKLNFYDITTKTDAAGRATEKTQFTFKLIRHTAEVQQVTK